MPTIEISQDNFLRLQALATPLVDTPDTVIKRLLDGSNGDSASRTAQPGDVRQFDGLELDPDSPENLTFTRVRSASFGSKQISRPNWNKLVRLAHQEAMTRLNSFSDLAAVTIANIEQGELDEYGFHYVLEADISVQGLAADVAWPCSLKLARHLGVPIRVVLEWQNKDDAAHPGQRAMLSWTPSA